MSLLGEYSLVIVIVDACTRLTWRISARSMVGVYWLPTAMLKVGQANGLD